MKKLQFKLGEQNKLTKEQMKNIHGGSITCQIAPKYWIPGCSTETQTITVDWGAGVCETQPYVEEACAEEPCCYWASCGCTES